VAMVQMHVPEYEITVRKSISKVKVSRNRPRWP